MFLVSQVVSCKYLQVWYLPGYHLSVLMLMQWTPSTTNQLSHWITYWSLLLTPILLFILHCCQGQPTGHHQVQASDSIIWNCYNYTLPHSAKEPLVCQFICSISECNKRMICARPICNANVHATSDGCYIWIVTLVVVCAALSNNKTINVWFYLRVKWICMHARASGQVIKIEYEPKLLVFVFNHCTMAGLSTTEGVTILLPLITGGTDVWTHLW